jgi:hypothetical protein
MAVRQITIRLDPSSKAEFERYAGSLGLMASELFKLLIVRERQQRHLAKLNALGELPHRSRRAIGDGGRLPTITAHVSSVQEVVDFDDYANLCGLKRAGAGALLLEMELRERWLERALREPAQTD